MDVPAQSRRCSTIEAGVDDVDELDETERWNLEQVSLGVERLVGIGKEHAHRRRFGTSEDQTDLLVVMLKLRAQQPGGTVDTDDR